MTDQAKLFFEKVRNFPPEADRKESVFKSLNCILESIGSFLNDSKAEFRRETIDGKDTVIYRDSFGEHFQSVEGDDAKAFFVDSLKMLMENVHELEGSFSAV